MDELINEQIAMIQEEIEAIASPYEKAAVRAQFLIALSNLSSVDHTTIGKDAIKNDNIKPITFEEVTEETVSEIELEKEPAAKKKTTTKTTSKAKATGKEEGPNEISLENKAVIVKVEDENGNEVDLDVTEAYALLSDYEGEIGQTKEDVEADRRELASQITSYALAPVFSTLTNLTASSDKLMLAYYMQEYGIEEINSFVNTLTDGNYSDVYEFATNDTVGNLVADLEKAAEEGSEE